MKKVSVHFNSVHDTYLLADCIEKDIPGGGVAPHDVATTRKQTWDTAPAANSRQQILAWKQNTFEPFKPCIQLRRISHFTGQCRTECFRGPQQTARYVGPGVYVRVDPSH